MGVFQNLFSKKNENAVEEKDELEMDAIMLSEDLDEKKPLVGTEIMDDESNELPATPTLDDDFSDKTEETK